ncbi:unnamed protein product [Heligmosomoides polygyrus]|uniref:Transmembrane protein n=1 Tax=Heligmosomoides polygyrus TaxID=6339 RepID=A0A183FN43_HELPZ|nr:unnamed protein product [Heligmosomoides polygyrus]
MRALVTSSGQRHRLLQRVLDRPGLFGLVCYAAAIYYASFILDYKNAEHTRFDKDGLAVEYLQGLREHASDKQDYICRMMKEARMECHSQRLRKAADIEDLD